MKRKPEAPLELLGLYGSAPASMPENRTNQSKLRIEIKDLVATSCRMPIRHPAWARLGFYLNSQLALICKDLRYNAVALPKVGDHLLGAL